MIYLANPFTCTHTHDVDAYGNGQLQQRNGRTEHMRVLCGDCAYKSHSINGSDAAIKTSSQTSANNKRATEGERRTEWTYGRARIYKYEH